VGSAKSQPSRIEGVRRYYREDEDGNELVYYTGLMPSDIAKQITFVPVMKDLAGQKSPLNEIGNGYQRPGSGSRMRQFSKYLSAAPLAIVPPVLLSTRNRWTFIESEDADFGDLEISGPAAIIDGQHRMGGFIHLYESEDVVREIDFVAYENLSVDEEAQVFNTINGNAKGVPKGVGRIIEGSWSTKVVLMLKEDPGSPFYEKIFIASKREIDGALFNLASFDKEVKRTFGHGSFSGLVADENIEIMYEIMQKYWDLISEYFPVEWEDIYEKPRDQQYKLLELTGIIAFSLAAGDILGPNFDPNTLTMDWEQVRAIIEALAASGYLDLRKVGEFSAATGLVGGPRIHRKIQRALASIDL
jgi:DNA sulfur modification protein DndB